MQAGGVQDGGVQDGGVQDGGDPGRVCRVLADMPLALLAMTVADEPCVVASVINLS